jgi:hypothetical protein
MDVWYVDNNNFWLDLKVLALTIWRVLSRQGISHPGVATMEPFAGQTAAAPPVSDAAVEKREGGA